MQILVVVANIQVRNLSTEVDNGFVRTVIVHELVGPKVKVNPKKISTIMYKFHQKGIRLIFLNHQSDIFMVT